MRTPKPEWNIALKAECGENASVTFNEVAHRWSFNLPGADGIVRSQFWGHFDKPKDSETGLHPFRELDDGEFRIAMSNLRKTFVGGDTRAAVQGAINFNTALFKKLHREAGELFADMIHDRRRQIIRSVEGGKAAPVIAGTDFKKGE